MQVKKEETPMVLCFHVLDYCDIRQNLMLAFISQRTRKTKKSGDLEYDNPCSRRCSLGRLCEISDAASSPSLVSPPTSGRGTRVSSRGFS